MTERRSFAVVRSWGLADLLTAGNLACGLAALFAVTGACTPDDIVAGAAWLPFALLFDCLDGPVARRRATASPTGRELDSLVDAVSFGVAPAAIGYAAGYSGGWDRAVLVFFVFCGVNRLARFNVDAARLAESGEEVRACRGVPIPYSVLLAVGLGVLAYLGELPSFVGTASRPLGPWTLHPTVLVFAGLGLAMISSRIRLTKPAWWA
ncbi:MAG: CDP-alcohol phosphatidyltransferase family protein [Myxococcales bacterium]|nr:CDP-alcohol phosphatidyltransferase family protein [Myxococcales bacterium]